MTDWRPSPPSRRETYRTRPIPPKRLTRDVKSTQDIFPFPRNEYVGQHAAHGRVVGNLTKSQMFLSQRVALMSVTKSLLSRIFSSLSNSRIRKINPCSSVSTMFLHSSSHTDQPQVISSVVTVETCSRVCGPSRDRYARNTDRHPEASRSGPGDLAQCRELAKEACLRP